MEVTKKELLRVLEILEVEAKRFRYEYEDKVAIERVKQIIIYKLKKS